MHLEETPKLIQPRDHKAKVIIWADLTVSDMDVLEELNTTDAIKEELARLFDLGDYKENMKNAVLMDLYFYTLQFARKNRFNKEQTSAFFSIVKGTHEVAVETPFGNLDQCFAYFRELVLRHAVKRPPFSIDLFTAEHVQAITDYVINTYFRHFKMYKYVFTPLVRLDLAMTYPGMPETPALSEVGDDEDEEACEEEGQAATETEAPETKETDPTSEEPVQESAAASELRQLIKQHLSTELSALKEQVDNQIKETDDMLSQKLQAAEVASSGAGKAVQASSKGKKK